MANAQNKRYQHPPESVLPKIQIQTNQRGSHKKPLDSSEKISVTQQHTAYTQDPIVISKTTEAPTTSHKRKPLSLSAEKTYIV